MKFIQRFLYLLILVLSLLFIEKLLQIKTSVSIPQPKDRLKKTLFTSAKLVTRPIIYIKNFKCASSTIAEIIFRLSYYHKLDLMVPVKNRIYIGWPYKPHPSYILPLENKFYDLSNKHVIYERSFFENLMGPKGFYMTSLRNPFKQFKSLVHYYNILNISQVPLSQTRFEEFLTHLPFYDNFYKTSNSNIKYCVPQFFSMTRNPMASILNFPFLSGFNAFLKEKDVLELTKHHENKDDIIIDFYRTSNFESDANNQTKDISILSKLEKKILMPVVLQWMDNLKLDFVIFQEHFDESLVLLRRRLHWSLKDILYVPKNIGSYSYKDSKHEEMERIYKEWSWVDYMLYERFHDEFSAVLKEQGDEFEEELQHFKKILSQMRDYCASNGQWVEKRQNLMSEQLEVQSLDVAPFRVEASRWNEKIEINILFCMGEWKTSEDRRSTPTDLPDFC